MVILILSVYAFFLVIPVFGFLIQHQHDSKNIIFGLRAATSSSAILSMSTAYPSHIHVKEYPTDDYDHILGIDDSAHEPSRLQRITALRLKEVSLNKEPIDTDGCGIDRSFYVSAEDLEDEIKDFDSVHGGTLDLQQRILDTQPIMAIAAEFKRASPSKGDINLQASAVEQCVKYADVGAAVISVLTEYIHFKGTLADMRNARLETQKAAKLANRQRPCILRKDFILDRYQILEARANGADTVLLIVAILGVNQLKDLMSFCRKNDMEPLVEVHTDREMEIALECGAKVIGVNNRNLHTFQLDLDTTSKVCKIAQSKGYTWRPDSGEKPGILIAALSGITSREDVVQFTEDGVSCCLVGETLMKSADPKATIEGLVSDEGSTSKSFVKLCGMTSAADAAHAVKLGTSMIGVIFAKSPRTASMEQAQQIVGEVRKYGERSAPIDLSQKLDSLKTSCFSSAQWFTATTALLSRTTIRKPLVVGVFQNHSPSEINHIVRETGIDVAQLHGNEGPEYCDQVNVPCIKVVHVPIDNDNAIDVKKLKEEIDSFSHKAVGIILDSRLQSTSGGGTGKTFDWMVVESLVDDSQERIPVYLAGGITKENVKDALAVTGVSGVDASSSIETSPGKKDAIVMSAFLEAARQAASA